ncbi:MAG: alanine/glycine:cation symporter family protein, partial [Pygmaiobacter sp.]
IIIALGFMGNMVQANSISDAFHAAFGLPHFVTGVFVAAVSAFIFIGGKRRIASFSEKIVPLMATLYVLGGLIVVLVNFRALPAAITSIFVGAFHPQAVAGGVAGITVRQAIRYGVARGLFSNEAGMGSTPHAHALAKVEHPCDQGIVAMIGVFIDTFVVLTTTAFVILTTGALSTNTTGAVLAQNAFTSVFGNAGKVFIAICMLFFAFSTIIGWYFFGETNVRYLFGKKAVKFYSALVVVCVMLGSLMKVELVWDMSDMFNALMVIPNLIAMLALSGVVAETYKEYNALDRVRTHKK